MQNCSEHVVAHIKKCEQCTKATSQLQRGPLQPLESSRVMEIVEVDFFGPFPPSPSTNDRYIYFVFTMLCCKSYTYIINRYCCVMTDHFSGFTWAKTFKDKAQDNLVNWAYDVIMSGFGRPEILLSDNGGDVTNNLAKSIT
jgi:hypothetical protein